MSANANGASLHYIKEEALSLRRERSGRGFRYRAAGGRLVKDAAVLERIRALVLPPAWTDVRIADDPLGHLQAIGVDARGAQAVCVSPGVARAATVQ